MTIDRLVLRNFQAHKSTELEFCPGVNAIIGESDEGKTSIIRALYWASQNKPSGGNFISDFSKRGECSSTIVVDGNEITRFKNKSKNEYRINNQPFKALGKSGVPDEVKNILQLDELNFQNQMDSPFLLSQNGGEVARYLNDIVNLNVIDESSKRINKKLNDCNRDIVHLNELILNIRGEKAEYHWLDQAEKELLQLEKEQNNYLTKNADQIVFGDLLDDIDDLVEELEQYQDKDDEEYQIKLLIEEYKAYLATSDYLNEFKSDLNSLKTISNKIDSLPFDKKEIEDITLLSNLIDSFEQTYKSLSNLSELLNLIDNLEDQKEVCIESIQTLEIEFKKDFPTECNADSCPLMEI